VRVDDDRAIVQLPGAGRNRGVLLLGVIQNVINQIGTLDSSYQSVVSGAFLIVVVVAQTYLSRTQRIRSGS